MSWEHTYRGNAEDFVWENSPVMGEPGCDPEDEIRSKTVRNHHDNQIEHAKALSETIAKRYTGPIEIHSQGALGIQDANDPGAHDLITITVRSAPIQ